MNLKDPLGFPMGTMLAYITAAVVSVWAILQVMHYYAKAFHGVDIPLPTEINDMALGVFGIYLGYRKGENAGMAKGNVQTVEFSSTQPAPVQPPVAPVYQQQPVVPASDPVSQPPQPDIPVDQIPKG